MDHGGSQPTEVEGWALGGVRGPDSASVDTFGFEGVAGVGPGDQLLWILQVLSGTPKQGGGGEARPANRVECGI